MTVRQHPQASAAPPAHPGTTADRSHATGRMSGFRPYLYALLLQAFAFGVVAIGDHYARGALPWAMVSLLVVSAAASLWGARPALLIIVLAALFGDVIVPDLHISLYNGTPPGPVSIMRTLLFAACGTMIVAIAERMHRMDRSAEQHRAVVRALQRMILPEHLPQPPGWQAAWHYQPASREEEVGGDFYDLFMLEDGQYGIIVGDAMGKGKEAAMHTALLRYSVRSYLALGLSPGECLSRVDALIDSEWRDGATASLFVGRLQAASGILDYANAGHEAPLLGKVGREPTALAATGPILGTGIGMSYEDASATIPTGGSVLLFTDGVTEARNARGEFLDSDGAWRLFVCASQETKGVKILDSMIRQLRSYTGGVQHDDIAVMLLHRK